MTARVMTLNCASFKARWLARALILVARVLYRGPDILTCVELYASRRARMTKRLRHRYVLAGTYQGKVIYVRRGRFAVHTGSLLRMKLGNGKHALAVRLVDPVTGTKLVVVVAHLSWRIGADKRRHAQSHRLISLVEARFGATPAIYTGDWNSSIRKGKRKRDAVGDVFESRGLVEAFIDADKRTHDRYNSANRYLHPAPASGVHLDRVFGRGVEFAAWLLDYYLVRRASQYGSDHFGLVVTFRIPTP